MNATAEGGSTTDCWIVPPAVVVSESTRGALVPLESEKPIGTPDGTALLASLGASSTAGSD